MAVGFIKRLFGGDSGTNANRGKALIVDDEKQLRELMAVHLNNSGYQAVKASNAEEAREILEGGLNPTAIVLDVRMPGEDGVSLAKSLRRKADTAKIPIVFITGAFPRSQLDKLQESIPNCRALNKPVSAKALCDALDELTPPPAKPKKRNNESGRLPRHGSKIR